MFRSFIRVIYGLHTVKNAGAQKALFLLYLGNICAEVNFSWNPSNPSFLFLSTYLFSKNNFFFLLEEAFAHQSNTQIQLSLDTSIPTWRSLLFDGGVSHQHRLLCFLYSCQIYAIIFRFNLIERPCKSFG